MSAPDPLPHSLPKGMTARGKTWQLESLAARHSSSEEYYGRWVANWSAGEKFPCVASMHASDIDWPGEDLAAAAVAPSMEESLESLRVAIAGLKGWPLDKRETLVAFNMMGLTSRLQPLQVESSVHQQMVVALAVKLADLAILELGKP